MKLLVLFFILLSVSISKTKTDLQLFAEEMAFKESSNNPKIINKFGYKGKYQFGYLALKDLNIHQRKDYLDNIKLQEKSFLSLLRINKYRLRKEIKKYKNKTVHGVFITESGLLAAAHLVGANSVKKFLRSGKEIRDGNNLSLVYYIDYFCGYTLNIKQTAKINLINYAKTDTTVRDFSKIIWF